MRIFRFDPEVSIPITHFGSNFRIGPLTNHDARVRVQIMHVPPGGVIGRHATVVRQLFAVVAGSGWVGGEEGGRRNIGVGEAALWEVGERHDAGTDDGLTAVSVEGEFEMWAIAVTQDIVVSDYDPAWPEHFEQIRQYVWPAIEDVAVRIDHVGSTSVSGLAAKPIIDTDIVVASEDDIRSVITRLATIGYRWRGDLGVHGRQAFAEPRGVGLPRHNLYAVVEDNKAHIDHWLLRDVLRTDEDARRRYAELKRRNQQLAGGDMDVYVARKAALVAELLTKARAERGLPAETYWNPDVDS